MRNLFEEFEKILNEIKKQLNSDNNNNLIRFNSPWGQGYYYYNVTSYSSPDGIENIKNNDNSKGVISIEKRIKQLELELSKVVAEEDYEKAIQIRDDLNSLKENFHKKQKELSSLEDKKRKAVSEGNFEEAKVLKQQIDELMNNFISE